MPDTPRHGASAALRDHLAQLVARHADLTPGAIGDDTVITDILDGLDWSELRLDIEDAYAIDLGEAPPPDTFGDLVALVRARHGAEA